MNWDEEFIWEDITQTPKSPSDKKYFNFHHTKYDAQNGHPQKQNSTRYQRSDQSGKIKAGTKIDTSEDFSTSMFSLELLGFDQSNELIHHEGKMINYGKNLHDDLINKTTYQNGGVDNRTDLQARPEAVNNVTQYGNLTNVTQSRNSFNVTQSGNSKNVTQSGNSNKVMQSGNSNNLTQFGNSNNVTQFGNSNNVMQSGNSNNLTQYRNSNYNTTSRSDELNSVESRQQCIDATPLVPQSLCNGQEFVGLESQDSAKKMSSEADLSVNSRQYSKLGARNGNASGKHTLHEYEKVKMIKKTNRDNSTFNKHYHGRYYSELHSEFDEDDDERVTAILCLVFCVMGVGVVFGLIFILVQYSEHREQIDFEKISANDTYAEFKNSVYYQRVASVIRSVSISDQQRLFHGPNGALDSPKLLQCNIDPPNMLGNSTNVDLNITVPISEIVGNNSDVIEGGEWKPADCTSRHKVAIIIPYRDRWNHLKVLLHYLIPILKRQQIHFRIFIAEQSGNGTFNKGRVMNAAFRESLKLFDYRCVTFHDVDLVPEDDRNVYSCAEQPKHMSICIDKFDYVLPYSGLVGGVLMFKTEHFELVNGYSNMYWGWGAEDDDMTARILHNGLRIYRPPSNIARYKMVKHAGREGSEVAVRMKLLKSAARRSKLEGLNNVQYKVLSTTVEKLFTHFILDIGLP